MKIDFKVSGLASITRRIAEAVRRVLTGAQEGTTEVAERIAEKSRVVYVPIDTGALRDSIKVETKNSWFSSTSSVVAGGPTAPYAVVVHEIQKGYRFGKSWKYIEIPAKEESKDIPIIIGSKIRAKLG